LLPHRLANRFARIEPYGFIILLILLFTGALNTLIWPFVSGAMELISIVFGVPVGQLLGLAHAS
ncbi:MAG: site-2 protease family protein, partial [Pseudomonadota bacterium]